MGSYSLEQWLLTCVSWSFLSQDRILDVDITIHNSGKISYEIEMKILLRWGAPEHEELY